MRFKNQNNKNEKKNQLFFALIDSNHDLNQ